MSKVLRIPTALKMVHRGFGVPASTMPILVTDKSPELALAVENLKDTLMEAKRLAKEILNSEDPNVILEVFRQLKASL